MTTDTDRELNRLVVVERREERGAELIDVLACGHELVAVRVLFPTHTYRRRCSECGPYTDEERRGPRGPYATGRDEAGGFRMPNGPGVDGARWVYVLIYPPRTRFVHVRTYDDDGSGWQTADCGKAGEVRRLPAGSDVQGGMPMPVCRRCRKRSGMARNLHHAMTEHHRHYPRRHPA